MRWMTRLAALQGRRRLLAAGMLGVLSALALPPLYVLPLLLVAFPGLLALLEGVGPKRGFWIGCCFALGHHLVGLYWITEAILVDAAHFWWLVPFAVPFLSCVLAPFFGLPCALAARAPAGWPRVFVLAGAWSVMALAQQFTATGFPWNPLGSVWEVPGGFGDVFIQPAAGVGVHGLTLMTLLLAATPALGRRAVVGGGVALLAWAGFGLWRLEQPVLPAPGLSVVLVQGNMPEGEKFSPALARQNFETHLALTRKGVAAAQGGPSVVIWAETAASPYLVQQDAGARAAIAAAADGPALIGTVRFDAAGRPRNSLVALTGPGPPAAIYDKAHLVPFGEYQPTWIPLAFRASPGGGGFAAGPGPQTLHVNGVPAVGALICYEAIFPGAVVDPAERPLWLANVTNDAWFGNSSGPRQHLAAARMRAVEEGLPLMRAANTGISAGFDARGHELGRLGMLVRDVLVLPLPGALAPTLFARFGLLLPLALAALATAAGFIPRRKFENR